MKQTKLYNLLVTVGFILLVLALPARAWAHGAADGGAGSDDIEALFYVVLVLAAVVFLLVEGLIIYAIIRFRRRRQDEMPEQVEGNNMLELSWTVLAFVLVGVLFLLTLRALLTDYEVEADNEAGDPDLIVDVRGYMFNWDYEYFRGDESDTGVLTTRKLTIPANRAVLLRISSSDVQHSFWVPELAGKLDAIPGYVNTMWLKVNEPGFYEGNCAEYCGTNHYNMLIDVEVLEPAAFDAWLAEREARAGGAVPIGTDLDTPLPAGDPANGLTIFNELGCTACHQAEADQASGPSIARMKRDAEEYAAADDDMTPQDFLRESILLPCAVLAEGWEQCIMPQDYGTNEKRALTLQTTADLIEYLLEQP